jgi:hypothetical protein
MQPVYYKYWKSMGPDFDNLALFCAKELFSKAFGIKRPTTKVPSMMNGDEAYAYCVDLEDHETLGDSTLVFELVTYYREEEDGYENWEVAPYLYIIKENKEVLIVSEYRETFSLGDAVPTEAHLVDFLINIYKE